MMMRWLLAVSQQDLHFHFYTYLSCAALPAAGQKERQGRMKMSGSTPGSRSPNLTGQMAHFPHRKNFFQLSFWPTEHTLDKRGPVKEENKTET